MTDKNLHYQIQFQLDASNLLKDLRNKKLEWKEQKMMSYYQNHDVEYIKQAFGENPIPYEALMLTESEIKLRNTIYSGIFITSSVASVATDDIEYIKHECTDSETINPQYLKWFLEELHLFLDIYSDQNVDVVCECLKVLNISGTQNSDSVTPIKVYGLLKDLKYKILDYNKLRKNAYQKYSQYIVDKCVEINSKRCRPEINAVKRPSAVNRPSNLVMRMAVKEHGNTTFDSIKRLFGV